MHPLDYAIILIFMILLLVMGFYLSKRAGKNTDEFILAGRRMPWWLAGTSIAATGLNASTMLNDSRKIRQDGLSGLWYTWSAVVGNLLMAIWFARLWRRGQFTTQMEFYEARYEGKAATWARIYDSVVYGILVAAIWAAVGLVAMKKIAAVLLGLPPDLVLLGTAVPADVVVVLTLVLITLVYSAASGVHGVVWTDFVEFFIAMVASFILMVFVFRDTGWNTGLNEKITNLGGEGERLLSLIPTAGPVLVYFFLVQPIIGMGGYGPAVQRYLCVKDERETLYTAFYNVFLNFVLKPWPFYVCGLCGIFLVTDQFLMDQFPMIAGPDGNLIPDYEKAFPVLVSQYLPVGLVGLMVAGFLSAFMSSFDTNIHNSTAIVINDIYRPYLAKGRDERHYVRASRVYMVLVTILASALGILSHDILKLSMFAIAISLAPGLVKLLRFIWWRVNGITEVITQWVALILAVVMISPVGTEWVNRILLWYGHEGNDAFHMTRQVLLMGASTLVSLVVLAFTRPEPMDKLCSFYRRVRPFGWWGPVRQACGPDVQKADSIRVMLALTAATLASFFSSVFAVIGFLLAMWTLCLGALACLVPSLWATVWGVRRLYPKSASGDDAPPPTRA
jgi:solute:Na+ symporter, SSS family